MSGPAGAPRRRLPIQVLASFGLGSLAQGIPFVLVLGAVGGRGSSAVWVPLAAAARLAPYLVCSPFAGTVAARVEPRSVLVVAGMARGAIGLGVAVALVAEAPAATLVALLFGLTAVGTAAYPSLLRALREVTPRSSWIRTSAVAAGLESVTFWLGPAVGGLLLVLGAGMAATVGAGLSLVSAVIACRLQPGTREVIRYPKTSRSTAPTLDAVIADGVRVLVRPVVRRRVVAAMGINALAGVLATALVGWAADASADGPQLLGVLTVAQGVGAVLAFSAILVSGREATRWSVALVAAALSMIVIGASGRPSIALVACTIFGASVVASELVVTVAIGTSSSGREVAAATGVLDAALVGAMVAGVLLSPVLGAVVGTPRSLVVVGCLPLAGGVLSLTGRPRWPSRVSLAPHAGADLARAGASVAPPPIALSRPDSSRVNRPAPIERT